MRSLISEGWEWEKLAKGLLAILGVAAVSHGLAAAALRGRIKQS